LGGISFPASDNYVLHLQNDPASSTGYHQTYTYLDGLGRPIQVRDQSETSGQYRATDIFYNSSGELLSQTYPVFSSGAAYVEPSGNPEATVTYYDPIERPEAFYPCATISFYYGYWWSDTLLTGDSGSPIGPVSLSYYAGNNPWAIVVTDARGKIHTYDLDAFGRTNQIIEVTSGGNFTTTLAYNQVGDLTNITDNASNKIAMFFDLTGNRVAMADPDMGFWQYGYDLDGRPKTQTDPKGQQLKFYYNDSAGRLTQRNGYNAAGQQVSTNIWSYDSSGGDTSCTVYPGQIYQITDDQGWQKFSYDIRNRNLKSVRYLSKNGNTYTNQFTFDDADRLNSTIYPNGGPTVTNIFDNGGGHLSLVKQGTTTFYTANGFNALNQLTGVNFGNGVGTTLNYYSVSRRLQQIVSAKSTNLQNLTYSFDTNGNVTAVSDGVYSGSASGTISSASYDDLNRLTAATWSGYGTKIYGYSSVGNVLTNGEFGSGAYNYGSGAIRPDCVRSANGSWFTYDLDGNIVFRTGQRLDYDVNNHLWRVINTNGLATFFGYDANGARLWESSGTNALQVWIDGNYEEKQGQILYHIYAGGRLVATFDKTRTNVFQFYHPDDLTSTSIQTDTNGAAIQNYEYSAFGQSRYTQSTNVFKVSRRYTSQILDDATGLYYYNARYYDPILGRFTQPDPIIPDLFNPQTYNRYAYCVNNPLRYTDPSGHSLEDYVLGMTGLADFVARGNADEWAKGVGNRGGNLGFKSFADAQNYLAEQKDPAGLNADVRLAKERTDAVSATASATVGMAKTEIAIESSIVAPEATTLEGTGIAATEEQGAGAVVTKAGRLGNQATREQVAGIAGKLEQHGWEITGGGGKLPEEYIPGPGGARKGSSYPDITATKNGETLRVNTIDTRANGVTPTTREANNAARIRSQKPDDTMTTVPKSSQ
jgi:RHS repeat-associated protein